MYSAGSAGGSGWPDMATSMRCMARMNSSAVSFPSWSMSERFLPNKKHAVTAPPHPPATCSICLLGLQANVVSLCLSLQNGTYVILLLQR